MHQAVSNFPVNDGSLYCESAGAGDPVVFLHGFGLDGRAWDAEFAALQPRYRVIRYDLRGFGRSSLPTATPYAHEDDLFALLTHLRALPAHVVGHSMGGRMALRFAAAFPDALRSLVLVDSALDGQSWTPAWQARWSAMQQAASSGRVSEAVELWLTHPLFHSAHALPAAGRALDRMIRDYSGWHLQHKDPARVPSPPLAARLDAIRVPSLVMLGALDLPDFHAVADRLAAGLPLARLVTIADAGHMVNLEAPTAFLSALESFWRSLPPNEERPVH